MASDFIERLKASV